MKSNMNRRDAETLRKHEERFSLRLRASAVKGF